MKLKKLKLRNFQGISQFELDAGCVDISVFGKNGSGKTTLANSVSWLLFDKNSLGQTNFEIKPKNSSNVEVEVEGTFSIDDDMITLKKVYAEKWTKRRGSLESEMTGHTTDYFVNDVPVKMGEYKNKVAEIATREEIFRLLTSPTYFNETMHWQKRRSLLFDICGTITDADVIASHPELSELPAILAGKNADDYKKIVMGQRKKINESIESIPARIDEAQRSKPEISWNNSQSIIAKLTKQRAALDAKNQESAQVQAGGGVAEMRIKLVEQDLVIRGITNRFLDGRRAAVQVKKDELAEQRDILADRKRDLQLATATLGSAEADLKNNEETKADLLAEYTRLKKSFFTEENCPTCLQPLPADQIEDANKRFNENKAKALESNIEKGLACKAAIQSLIATIENTKITIADNTNSIAAFEKLIEEIFQQIIGIENSEPSSIEHEEMKEATAVKAQIVKQIDSLLAGSADTIAALTAEKTAIETTIAEHEKQLAQIEQALAADLRIEELKAEENKLAGEFAKLEKHLFLIESFIKAKVGMLTDSINGKFKIVKFQLFRDQINGGIEEICDAMVDGVPYNSLNHASRIHAGCDIINTVGDFYNFHPIIFVDGRESVTELPDMQAQVISLVVSPGDDVLRVGGDLYEQQDSSARRLLDIFESCGVDNWEGYSEVQKILNDRILEQKLKETV